MTATDLSDITWTDISDAGIDTATVERVWNNYGTQNYVATNPTTSTRVAFGPAEDPVYGGTDGWDVATYEILPEGYDQIAQNWCKTTAQCLALVRDMLA
jgi:hypothetical protein